MVRALFIGLLIYGGLTSSAQTIDSLHLLGEYDVPFNQSFQGTRIGGLSGIDYDPVRKVYYMISDDRSDINPARYYTAKIYLNRRGAPDSVVFTGVTTLLGPEGNPYPSSNTDPGHAPDPEALRLDPTRGRMVWTSEGERIVTPTMLVLEDPAITIISPDGHYIDTFPLPFQLHMHQALLGPRQNSVFEGAAFANHFNDLYVTVEEPLYQDGPRAGLKDTATWTRVLRYDVESRKLIAEYAYHPEPLAYPPFPRGAFSINGIPDIMYLGGSRFLMLERSFSMPRLACTIRVFQVDFGHATNIASVASLRAQPPARPAVKKLLLNMDKLGTYIDNIEGVTFGPSLPNGHRTLLFVADNNFNPLQRSQFLVFEVFP